jgi:dienelactone hydrolase
MISLVAHPSHRRRRDSCSRRRVSRALFVLCALLGSSRAQAQGIEPPAGAMLPPLPGPFDVATITRELVDEDRLDPLAPTEQPRSLIVQLWYPARVQRCEARAPYMAEPVAAVYEANLGLAPGALSSLPTRAALDAPARRSHQGWPVVLFSPGRGISRSLYTHVLEGLASAGFAVLAIDHPYDAVVVQFPDGRVVRGLPPPAPAEAEQSARTSLALRMADITFVLDRLPALDALADDTLDLQRVGIFGHSLGGAAASLQTMRDARLAACANIDGTIFGGVVEGRDVERPFLLVSSAGHGIENDATWATYWQHLRGFRLHLQIQGSTHSTYTDLAPLAVILGVTEHVPADQLARLIGTLDGARAAEVELAYLTAFFRQTLQEQPSRLLDGPHPRFPEMLFLDP